MCYFYFCYNSRMFSRLVFFCCTIFLLQFTGCKSDVSEYEINKNATLDISLQGTSSLSRSQGTSLPSNEDRINTLAVGVFYADGSVNLIAEPEITDTFVSSLSCSPGICDIAVVANAPSGTFSGVSNRDDFMNKVISLNTTASGGIQTSDNLPMSGIAESVELKVGVTTRASIVLSRLVARVSLSNVRTEFDPKGQYSNATLGIDKVFLYDANGTSKVTPGTYTVPSSVVRLYGGTVNNGTWESGTPYLLNELSTPQSTINMPHWFYTFANTDMFRPTKLVLSGMFDADGSGSVYAARRVYYPIVVNKAQLGTHIEGSGGGTSTISRNTSYCISAVIKGAGAETPEINIEPVEMQLTLTVSHWELTLLQDVEIY